MKRSTWIYRGKLGVCIALLSILLVGTSSPMLSAQAADIGGKPAYPDPQNQRTKTIFVKTITPGASISDAVAVTNNTNTPKTISVYSTDSVASSGGGYACAQAVEKPKGVGTWIALQQTTITVPATTTRNVPFTITVPSRAEPGEQNGCIVLQENKAAVAQGGISLSFRTAIRVAILVAGDVHKGIDAKDIVVASEADRIMVSPTIQNTGNVSIDADITPQLKTIFGTVVSQQTSTFPVLRDQPTSWSFDFKKPFWGGLYSATYSVRYDASKNYLGAISDKSQFVTVSGPTKLVFVLPDVVAACIELCVLLFVGSILWYWRRRVRSKNIQQTWITYKVRKTDNIDVIAQNVGVPWRKLAKANKLEAPYNLTTGQIIRVPSPKLPGDSKKVHSVDEKNPE